MSEVFRQGRYTGARCELSVVALRSIGVAACAPKGETLHGRALQALANGNVNAAVFDRKNFVVPDAINARGRALLGQALAQTGDKAGALAITRKVDIGQLAAAARGAAQKLLEGVQE